MKQYEIVYDALSAPEHVRADWFTIDDGGRIVFHRNGEHVAAFGFGWKSVVEREDPARNIWQEKKVTA